MEIATAQLDAVSLFKAESNYETLKEKSDLVAHLGLNSIRIGSAASVSSLLHIVHRDAITRF